MGNCSCGNHNDTEAEDKDGIGVIDMSNAAVDEASLHKAAGAVNFQSLLALPPSLEEYSQKSYHSYITNHKGKVMAYAIATVRKGKSSLVPSSVEVGRTLTSMMSPCFAKFWTKVVKKVAKPGSKEVRMRWKCDDGDTSRDMLMNVRGVKGLVVFHSIMLNNTLQDAPPLYNLKIHPSHQFKMCAVCQSFQHPDTNEWLKAPEWTERVKKERKLESTAALRYVHHGCCDQCDYKLREAGIAEEAGLIDTSRRDCSSLSTPTSTQVPKVGLERTCEIDLETDTFTAISSKPDPEKGNWQMSSGSSEESEMDTTIPVFVIDGDENSREVLGKHAQRWGMSGRSFESVENFIPFAEDEKQRNPEFHSKSSIIFFEVRSAGNEAIDGMNKLRPYLSESSAVVIGTSDNLTLKTDCLSAGMTTFLQKPISPAEYRKVVKRLQIQIGG